MMAYQRYLCLAMLVIISFSLTSGSYLGYPRINFAGFFRADSNTRNNNPCNYRHDYNPDDSNFNDDWGFNGTNEFQWFENKVTSVFRQNGSESKNDSIIGKHVMSNLKRPFAKLVDLDTDCQNKSTIYGMKFGIAKKLVNPEDNMQFFGNWTPSVIAQDMWSRVACYSDKNTGGELYQDSFPFGASGTTVITNIFWDDNIESPVLQELKAASDAVGGTLSVRVALSYYTRNLPSYIPYNATLGYVMGTIGIPSPTDTLNVGGNRIMVPVSGSVPVGYNNTLKSDDLCYKQDLSKQTWVSKAPFKVDAARKELAVDFSNAFAVNLSNTLIDIGSLKLAIQSQEDGCVQILTNGAIPYLTEDLLQTYSGILTASLETEELNNLQNGYALLVVQVYDNNNGGTSNICGDFLSTGATDAANVLSREPEYFIRPKGYYVGRVSKGDTSNIAFYVTRYGNPVKTGTYIRLVPGASLPKDVIKPDQYMKQISNGTVDFTFTAVTAPPRIREYPKAPCKAHPHDMTLPIEGNVYFFGYQHCTSNDNDSCSPNEGEFNNYTPVFLFFSDVADVPDDKVNWVDNVGPVLSQFAQVSPIMKYILDMSNYTEVIQPHNRELMKRALGRAFTDPGHMPTTRDLPPKRRDMILAWLNQDGQPLYDSEGTTPPVKSEDCVPPPALMLFSKVSTFDPRCYTILSAGQHPSKLERYYEELSDPNNAVVKERLRYKVKGRPLMGLLQFLKDKKEGNIELFESDQCQLGGVDALREQLQTAVALEFATIPVYLTALYSIVEGCNRAIYNRIRSVVMQEMVHMAQAANILIALGGDPVIDSPDFVPIYPTNLPGKVLPGLTVSLQKLSLRHVKEVLMGIETPVETEVGNPPIISDVLTIGAFYAEISTCIGELGNSIFKQPREDRQVLWPWTPSDDLGEVIKVTNVQEAQSAIDMIVEQGEGTTKLDPDTTNSSSDLAHFFKFEEIVCGKELVYKHVDQTYSYSGDEVPFNADGVWNMRDNPKAGDIHPHTNCYVEAKAFHAVFRNLLRNLDDTFNGLPERVTDTVLLMESLHVHAKKTMWTKFAPSSFHTCGPVWDYHWTAGVDHVGREGTD